MELGETLAFEAIGTLFVGGTVDLTNQVFWESSNPNVVTISNNIFTRGHATALTRGEAVISARSTNGISSSDSGQDARVIVPEPLVSIRVLPGEIELPAGFTRSLEAEGTRADGTVRNISKKVTWLVNDPAVAEISNESGSEGELTALGTGVALVSAAWQGISSEDAVITVGGRVVELSVRPDNVRLAVGTDREFSVRARLEDDSFFNLPDRSAEWISGNPAVATVDSAGVVTAVSQGETVLSVIHRPTGMASANGARIQVLGGLTSLRVTPRDRAIDLGHTKSMTAIGTFTGTPDGQGTADITDQVFWTSSDPSVISVSNDSGSRGHATALRQGIAYISAISQTGISSSDSGGDARVRGVAEVLSLRIVPIEEKLPVGFTRSIEAEATRADGSVDEISSKVTWSTSNATIAMISNESSHQGEITGLRDGNVWISAIDPGTGVSSSETGGDALITVGGRVATLSVRPPDERLPIGGSRKFSVRVTMEDGSFFSLPRHTVTWTSSNPATATVSNEPNTAGLVTALERGEAVLSAVHPATGMRTTDNATVEVLGTLIALRVTPRDRSIDVGETKSMTAIGTFAGGATGEASAEVTDQVFWESSDPTVVSVSNDSGTRGRATGLEPGVAFIIARSENGISSSDENGDARVRVTAELASIRLVPSEIRLPLGFTRTLDAEGTRIDGSVDDVSNKVTWVTSDPSVATVRNDSSRQGELSAIGNGVAVISATDPETGISSTATGGDAVVTVGGEVVGLSVRPAEQELPVGLRRRFSVRATLQDGSSFSLPRRSVVWTSSKPAVATVSNDSGTEGLVTALAKGETVLSAMHPPTGLNSSDSGDTARITVPGSMLELEVRPRHHDLFIGGTERFSAYALLEEGREVKLSQDVEFTSSDPSVAVVSNASGERGDATGIAQGTVTISVTHPLSGLSSSSTGGDATARVLGTIQALRVRENRPLRTGDRRELRASGQLPDPIFGNLAPIEFNVSDVVEWTSSNPAVVRVEGDEVVAVGLGEATVAAYDPLSGVSSTDSGGDAIFRVIAELKKIKIKPKKIRIRVSTSRRKAFRAIGYYTDGAHLDITRNVEFSTEDPSVGQVSNDRNRHGAVVPISRGKTAVRAVEPVTGTTSKRARRLIVKRAKRRGK